MCVCRGVGGGISPFMLDWSSGMLTGYSANLVSSGSHAERRRARGLVKVTLRVGGW